MESESLKKLEKIQKHILNYVDHEDDSEDNLQKIIDDSKFVDNKNDFLLIILFILNISNNYHREPFFFNKIDKILFQLKNDINKYFSDQEIFEIFINNKRVLLFLFENKIIAMDQYIYDIINNKVNYKEYFKPEIQDFLKPMEKQAPEKNFEEKRKLGENDNYICELIRNDSVEEFISYCNRINISVDSTIKPSIFETNSLLNQLIDLIEYAAFFGSIQIFQYLKNQGVKLTKDLWYYAIHSNKPELIHLLEENHVKFPYDYYVDDNERYIFVLKESLKCHHNDITNYLINVYSSNESKKLETFTLISRSIESYNFELILKAYDLDISYALFYFCKYKYYNIVDILVNKGIDVNRIVISILFQKWYLKQKIIFYGISINLFLNQIAIE